MTGCLVRRLYSRSLPDFRKKWYFYCTFPRQNVVEIETLVHVIQIHLQPELHQINSFLQNIHIKLTTSLAKVPRLSTALGLDAPRMPDDYCAVVSRDVDFQSWQAKILDEIARNDQKMLHYLDQWKQYEYLWQSNKQQTIARFEHVSALDFDRKTLDYAQLAHSIDVREATSRVHLLSVNAESLRKAILLEIDEWKCLFLHALKEKGNENLKQFYAGVESGVKNVASISNSTEKLHKCSETNERLHRELDRCKCTMNELNEQFDVLKKYGITLDNDHDELSANIQRQWNKYLSQLADADEMLSNANVSFKLSLESERKTPDIF